MADDRGMFDSIRYATNFLGALAFLAIGIWELRPAVQSVVECATPGASCASYAGGTEAVYAGFGFLFLLLSGVMFFVARSIRRSLRLRMLREAAIDGSDSRPDQS